MKNRDFPSQRERQGSTLAEIVVAAVLVSSMASLIGTLVVRSGRIWQQTRHAQFAMDELSNQMERLTALDSTIIKSELESLAASDEFKSTLPDAKLTGKLIADEHGERIELSLSWERPVPSLPTTLVGWVHAAKPDVGDKDKEPGS